jgi:hypothetical protein
MVSGKGGWKRKRKRKRTRKRRKEQEDPETIAQDPGSIHLSPEPCPLRPET